MDVRTGRLIASLQHEFKISLRNRGENEPVGGKGTLEDLKRLGLERQAIHANPT